MALTQNTYTGDGSTVLFSFTFPYLDTTDIKVSLNEVDTTAYTLDNATTVRFNTAPAVGAEIRIYRKTRDDILKAEFYPGSAIRAQDLNNDFTQNLYVTQESAVAVATADAKSEAAMMAAADAISNSIEAKDTAEGAAIIAGSSIQKADTALAAATAAETKSNSAVQTANTAKTASDAATSASNSATTAANAATTAANTATTTANSALTKANTAISDSATAKTTATNADTKATNASTVATRAESKADAAVNAVAQSVQYQLVINKAAIPANPSQGTAVEVTDSTGMETFSPVLDRPVDFVGDSGLSVRMQWNGSAWLWLNYFANSPESRYVKVGTTATTTTEGLVQLATTPEAIQGTDTTLAVTPAGVAAAIGNISGTADGTTTTKGIVMLDDTPGSASTTKAATPRLVKLVADSVSAIDTKATNADTKATAAETKATDADTKATAADTKATNAQTAATTADGKAVAAQTAANTADGKAVAAQTSANNADTKAVAAQNSADSAHTLATSANTLASGALPKSGGTMTGAIAFVDAQVYPQIPPNTISSGYTLVKSDAGKHINSGGHAVYVPSGVFASGDAVSIFNNSSANLTIHQNGGVTLRSGGTAETGNRTLAQYGLCTVLCVGSNHFVLCGVGIS